MTVIGQDSLNVRRSLVHQGQTIDYYSLPAAQEAGLGDVVSLPFSLKIPGFSEGKLTTEVQFDMGKSKINRFELTSSLIQSQGMGTFSFSNSGKINALNLQFRVELSPSGSAAFGQYLPLISQGTLEASDSKFKMLIKSSSSGLPKFQFSKIL